jgi:hypothetical protein
MIAIRIGTMCAIPKAGLKPGNLLNLLAGPPRSLLLSLMAIKKIR